MNKSLLKFTLVGFTLLLTACGDRPYQNETEIELNEVNERLEALSRIAGSLDALIESDYASCSNQGDTVDPLVNKICLVAQAATVEVQVELQAQLGSFVNQLEDQIEAVNNDLASHQVSISGINATLINIQADIITITSRITSAEAAIDALEDQLESITDTLSGTMISLSVGEENVSAGPVYEMVLRRVDRTRFNGYVEAYGSPISLPDNALTAVNGSAIVTVSATAHGLLVDDVVNLSGLTEGRGFTSGDLVGNFVVLTVPTVNSFTIQLRRNATQNGTFGGTIGVVQKFNGRGMATLWKTGDASDSSVRVTSVGSRSYNFIIRRLASDSTKAELCYSSSDRSASIATINAVVEGGFGNIVCK
jgi:hypothetical protein